MSTLPVRNWSGGVVGGLAGGIVFGVMMGMMGMLPMVAQVVGSESAAVGFIYHLFNSLIIGLLFVAVFSKYVDSMVSGMVLGLLHGFIWWILGPLLLMPVLMGMGPQFTVAGMTMALPSLFGHVLYGIVLGVVYVSVKK
ncbi:MAG: hypothetical protein AB7J40_02625 [Candidatus Altimarinota bacterium]